MWKVSATKVPVASLQWTYQNTDFLPHSIGSDGVVYGHRGSDRYLARSTDGGATMELGQNFGAGGYCQSGEYVIWVTRVAEGYVVVTSSDVSTGTPFGGLWFGTSFTGPFTKIVTTLGINDFCISKPEIGPGGGTLIAVGEYSTITPQPTHVLRLTTDGGQSWTTVKTAVNVDTSKNSHFHGAAYDITRGRLWSSQGDNGNSMWAYSDNLGVSWTPVAVPSGHPLYQADSPYQQPTTVISFPDRVAVSPDRGSFAGGVWTMDAATGDIPWSAWTAPRYAYGETAPNLFGRSPYVQDGNEAIMVIPDRFAGSLRAYFVGTGDGGLTWHILSTVTLTSSGGGSTPIVGPDNDGLVYWKSVGNPAPFSSNLMVAPMPTWQEVLVWDELA